MNFFCYLFPHPWCRSKSSSSLNLSPSWLISYIPSLGNPASHPFQASFHARLFGKNFLLLVKTWISLFSLLCFPRSSPHLPVGSVNYPPVATLHVGTHFPSAASRFPPARFPFLTSLFRLFLLFTHILLPPLFGWYFWIRQTTHLFHSKHRQVFHMFYIKLCACACVCMNTDVVTSQNVCFQARAKAWW